MNVLVPRSPPPRFPDRCVVCGREHPAASAQLLAQVPTGSRWVWDSYSVRVPCCYRHALLLHLRRLGGSLVLWVLFIGGLVVGVEQAPSRLAARLFGAAGASLIVLARFAIDRWLPARFDLDPRGDSVTFAFRDLSMGYEFRALNPAARDAGGLTSA